MPIFKKNKFPHLLLFLLASYVFLPLQLQAQKKKNRNMPNTELEDKDTTAFSLTQEVLLKPTIELNPGKEEEERKKEKVKVEKRKKKVFYSEKTKRRFIKTTKGRNTTIEVFHVLKEYVDPPKYAPVKYYYHEEKKELINSRWLGAVHGVPLHGTYLKLVNGDTVVHGIFYMGTRHGRWEQWRPGEEHVLIDKKYYYHGQPKDAIITYWDADQTKVKEVIPMQHGTKTGIYLSYYETGRLKEQGEYEQGKKINKWYSYYNKSKKPNKREVQYPKYFWEDEEPVLLREWNEEGEQTYSKFRQERR